MNITKHGNRRREGIPIKSFKCKLCGCEFVANADEYYYYTDNMPHISSTTNTYSYIYRSTATERYICSCPECHVIVVDEKEIPIECPTITLTSTSKEELDSEKIVCKGE